MLKRREECDTYLTHVCRHHCSRESPVKRWNIRSLHPTLWFSSAVMSTEMSQVGVTNFPFFNIFYYFIFPCEDMVKTTPCVFTYIYSLLSEKDISDCRNVSIKLPFVYFHVSSWFINIRIIHTSKST